MKQILFNIYDSRDINFKPLRFRPAWSLSIRMKTTILYPPVSLVTREVIRHLCNMDTCFWNNDSSLAITKMDKSAVPNKQMSSEFLPLSPSQRVSLLRSFMSFLSLPGLEPLSDVCIFLLCLSLLFHSDRIENKLEGECSPQYKKN